MKLRSPFSGVMALAWLASALVHAQPLSCNLTSGAPPLVRAEGIAERIGELILVCTGGDPSQSTNVTFRISLNTTVTSRIVAGPMTTEALLLIDDPMTPVLGSNAFRGTLVGANTVEWSGIPFAPPGGMASRILRWTNLRGNASQSGPAGGTPSSLIAFASATPSGLLSIQNSQVVAAFPQPAASVDVRRCDDSGPAFPSFQQTAGVNRALATGQSTTGVLQFNLRFTEAFATAFRSRMDPQQDPSLPGVFHATESGYVHTANLGTRTGVADQGTRLRAVFTNVPAGVGLFVTTGPLPGSSSSSVSATLGALEASGAGSLMPLPGTATGMCIAGGASAPIRALAVAGGAASAVWEITDTNPTAIERASFGIAIAYDPQAGLPGAGAARVNAGFAPVSTLTGASATAPVPRFVNVSTPKDAFSVGPTVSQPSIVSSLPNGFVGVPYAGTLSAVGGSEPYTWFVSGLPGVLSLNPSAGTITGTPSAAGSFAVTAVVTDSLGQTASGSIDFVVTQSTLLRDRLVVGSTSVSAWQSATQSIPLPSQTDQKFCEPVRLAPDVLAWTYVPTALERDANFGAFASRHPGELIDPMAATPFPSGTIPANRIPGVWAWRIAPAGPASTESCQTVPAFLRVAPFFQTAFYVTGLDVNLDQILALPENLQFQHQAGRSDPGEQFVNVTSTRTPLSFHLGPVQDLTEPPSGAARWLLVDTETPCCSTPGRVRARTSPTGLPPGSHLGGFTITALGAKSPPKQTLVTMRVDAPRDWVVVREELLEFAFDLRNPQAVPGPRPLHVDSIGQASRFSATPRVATPPGVNWLRVSPQTGIGPAQLTVSIDPEAVRLLGRGKYLGFVSVSARSRAQQVPRAAVGGPAESDCPVNVAVTLDVQPPPAFTFLPGDGLLFRHRVGEPPPGPSTVTLSAGIRDPGDTTDYASLTFPVRSEISSPPCVGWLGATPERTSVTGTLNVSVNSGAVGHLGAGRLLGFVSISPGAVTGAVIPIRLGIEPSTQTAPIVRKVLAQVADGGDWKTTIILANTDLSHEARVTLRFWPNAGSAGRPLAIEGRGQIRNLQLTETIPAGGTLTLRTGGGPQSQLWQGWAELEAPASVGGTALFRQQQGNVRREGAVPLKPAPESQFLLPFDNEGSFQTSLAILNASETSNVTVSVSFRSDSGAPIEAPAGTQPLVLQGKGHQAFSLVERYPFLAGRRGVAEFAVSGGEIAGLGLRFNNDRNVFTSFETLPSGGTMEPQRIAHLADGTDWKSSLVLVNKNRSTQASVSIRFFGSASNSAAAQLRLEDGSAAPEILQRTIPPAGVLRVDTEGGPGGLLWQGWAEVTSTQPVGGFAVFRQRLGAQDSEGAVLLTPTRSGRLFLPYDNTGPFVTSMAVASFGAPGGANLSVFFRDANGAQVIPPGFIPFLAVGTNGHDAFDLANRFNLFGNGLASFSATAGDVVGLGFRFGDGIFTSLPVLR